MGCYPISERLVKIYVVNFGTGSPTANSKGAYPPPIMGPVADGVMIQIVCLKKSPTLFGRSKKIGGLILGIARNGGVGQISAALLVGIINTRTVDYFFDDIIKDFPSFRWR